MGKRELDLQLVCCVGAWVTEILLPSSLATYGRQDSWPWALERVKMGHVPHQLQHCEEKALHPALAGYSWPWLRGFLVIRPLGHESMTLWE